MDLHLADKVAVVTGSSRGLGFASAKALVGEGARVCVCARGAEGLAKAVTDLEAGASIPGQVIGVESDLSNADGVELVINRTVDTYGGLDILVNNVAVRPHKPILEVTEEEWHDTLAINMHAAFYLCKAVLPGMMERKTGSIIALGGQSAITGRPGTSIVTTAKTGVLGLIRAVAAEMAPYNIRANMVNPGSTDTTRGNPEWYPEFQGGTERGSSEHLKEIPMGRQATVKDIANACLFFASDESAYITGDSVNVMGGRYIS